MKRRRSLGRRTAGGALFLLLLLTTRSSAQCCGDCDGSGRVTIDELVAAVGAALDECRGPTATVTPTSTPANSTTPTRTPTPSPTSPPSCRSSFSTSGFNLCFFRGRFNLGCGNSLASTFSSDGVNLLIQIDTMLASPPTVSFRARVDNATTASLSAWSSDNFQTTKLTSGSVQLTGNGQHLVIFPNTPPFMIQSCSFVQYNGDYLSNSSLLERGAVGVLPDAESLFERSSRAPVPVPVELADESIRSRSESSGSR